MKKVMSFLIVGLMVSSPLMAQKGHGKGAAKKAEKTEKVQKDGGDDDDSDENEEVKMSKEERQKKREEFKKKTPEEKAEIMARRMTKLESRHAKRMAKLDRLDELAQEKGNTQLAERAKVLRQKELDLYNSQKTKFEAMGNLRAARQNAKAQGMDEAATKEAVKDERQAVQDARAAAKEAKGAFNKAKKGMKGFKGEKGQGKGQGKSKGKNKEQ